MSSLARVVNCVVRVCVLCCVVCTPRYDRNKLLLKEIHSVQYVSCMNPTAGSFTINPRLQVHTHTHTDHVLTAHCVPVVMQHTAEVTCALIPLAHVIMVFSPYLPLIIKVGFFSVVLYSLVWPFMHS